MRLGSSVGSMSCCTASASGSRAVLPDREYFESARLCLCKSLVAASLLDWRCSVCCRRLNLAQPRPAERSIASAQRATMTD
jgi:hypothetical protein